MLQRIMFNTLPLLKNTSNIFSLPKKVGVSQAPCTQKLLNSAENPRCTLSISVAERLVVIFVYQSLCDATVGWCDIYPAPPPLGLDG